MDSEKLAERIAGLAREKLGEEVVVMDLRGYSPVADFFVVTTALSTTHAQAIADEVRQRLKKEGELPHHAEGYESGHWVLLDYVDVVVHIFLTDVRQFYGLERLWGDAPQRQVTSFRTDERA